MQGTPPLGICVIGGGRAGMIHARNFSSGRIARAELVSVVEPHAETRARIAAELPDAKFHAEYSEAIADPRIGAVVVATPSELHCAIVAAAAAAGKHILCEKPMAMNASECDEMIAAVERAGVKLQIGFMRRFDASFAAAKARVDSGEIGRVVLVKSLTHGPTTPKPWMYDIRQSNGPLSEVNSHDIDTLRWFSGSEFEEVYAIGGNFRSPDAKETFPDFYDNVVLCARLRNGMQGTICGAQGVQYGYDARCEVLGEKGLITVGHLHSDSVTGFTASGSASNVVRSWSDLFADAYRAEDEDFVKCVLDNRTPRATGVDGKAAVMVVNAGNQSIAQRRPVRLDEPGVTGR
jgi:myo-inositol 2-dehydrogenase/D-chiro-inositol 1-dehydrogenase/scyllo-inositol 2-dehydrogenase (NAD+)